MSGKMCFTNTIYYLSISMTLLLILNPGLLNTLSNNYNGSIVKCIDDVIQLNSSVFINVYK